MKKNLSERVVELLKDIGPVSGAELARRLSVSRQSVNYHLKKLVRSGEVVRTGRTKGAKYDIAGDDAGLERQISSIRFSTEGHEEEDVFLYVAGSLGMETRVRTNVLDIVRYAMTEMVNNVIEHSNADEGVVEGELTPYECGFSVRDWGIGAFESIRASLGLPDLASAALEVLKGRRTSAPSEHSGEGLFFTRQCSDRFSIQANGIQLHFKGSDSSIGRVRRKKGTLVEFFISRESKRILHSVFERYAPEELDYSFNRTVVHLSLYSESLQSRSLARRVMAGLNDFREVEMDFKGDRSIGQGFADELFRKFAGSNPDLRLIIRNIDPSLKAMISHVRTDEGDIQMSD